jgi:hypothetical protein
VCSLNEVLVVTTTYTTGIAQKNSHAADNSLVWHRGFSWEFSPAFVWLCFALMFVLWLKLEFERVFKHA